MLSQAGNMIVCGRWATTAFPSCDSDLSFKNNLSHSWGRSLVWPPTKDLLITGGLYEGPPGPEMLEAEKWRRQSGSGFGNSTFQAFAW